MTLSLYTTNTSLSMLEPIGLLNHIETSQTVSNYFLDPTCNEYCDLIG